LEENAFGKVSIATDLKRNSIVVLRRISRDVFEDNTHLAEFRSHVEALLKDQRDGFLRAQKVGVSAGQPLIIMTGADGRTLCEVLSETNFDATSLFGMFKRLVACLDRLHASGQVHGDIRPETVFFNLDGDLSFGEIAVNHVLCGGPPGEFRIHPEFMGALFHRQYTAPEAQNGEILTAKSDQFALAVVLAECLTGVRLKPGENPLALLESRHVSNDRKKIVSQLRPILSKALAIEPGERYHNCEAILDDAAFALKSVAKRMKRRRLLIAASVLLPLFVVGGIWGNSYLQQQQENDRIAQVKDKLISQIRQPYEVNISTISDAPVLNSLAAAAAAPGSTSLVDTYRRERASAKEQTDAERRRTERDRFEKDARFSVDYHLESVAKDQPSIFVFSSSDVKASGNAKLELSWTVKMTVPNSSRPKEDVIIALDVFDSKGEHLLDSKGQRLQKKPVTRTIPAESTSRMVATGSLRPPRPEGWNMSDNITLKYSILDGDKSVQWKEFGKLQIAEASWVDETKIRVTPFNVLKESGSDYKIRTKVSVMQGDMLRISATGQITGLASGPIFSILGFDKPPVITPAGVIVEERYKRNCTFVSSSPGDKWGALLLKFGEGDWQLPKLDPQCQIADKSGEVFLSINSVKKYKQKDDDVRFWQSLTGFEVMIRRRKITFQPGTLFSIKERILQKISDRSCP